MRITSKVSDHYTHGRLLEAIQTAVKRLGKTPGTVTVDDLGPVDEFHIGGRRASEDFLGQLALSADDHVLDVGCGLGGASRFVAHRFGSRVTGIDLTIEYVETGRVLCSWVGLDHRITLDHGSATATDYPDGEFDKAYVMHVGMNIARKDELFSELFRVLKPGGVLGIYDVMRIGEGELAFPLPWATSAATSAVASPEEYRAALDAAGFELVANRNRRQFALDFLTELQRRSAGEGGSPPLGLHLLMGETRAAKVANLVQNIAEGKVAPFEMVAGKRV
jgi:SAM-dependent methyltransferase